VYFGGVIKIKKTPCFLTNRLLLTGLYTVMSADTDCIRIFSIIGGCLGGAFPLLLKKKRILCL
jgi:hypothetical protein